MKSRKNKKRIWLWILLAVLAAGAAAAWAAGLIPFGSRKEDSSQKELPTAEAFYGSIEVTTDGSGSIEAASTRTVYLEHNGKLSKISVEEGDQISAGQVLAEYDKESLDTVMENKKTELDEINSDISARSKAGTSGISSPLNGRVKRIFAAEDDAVTEVVSRYGGLMELSTDGKLKVTFTPGVRGDASLTAGDEVRFEIDGHTKKGSVAAIGEETVTVTMEDDGKYDVGEEAIIYSRTGQQLGRGKLESNHPYLVRFDYGIIDSVLVEENDAVYSGTVLFRLRDVDYNSDYLSLLDDRQELVDELVELNAFRQNPVLTSPFDGYVKALDVSEDTDVEKDQIFCTVADLSRLNLKAEIDELDIDGVEIGQTARIVFDAFEEESYEGTVVKISGAGKNSGGVTTYDVTISLEGNTHLKDAMSATAVIVIGGKDNALLVPVDAVESDGEETYVTVVKNGETERRTVVLGLVNNQAAEILEGLSVQEQVLLPTAESGLQLPFYTSGSATQSASGRS